jgi:hypothetical protein
MRERQKACLLSAERIGTRNYYCNEANNWKSCYRSLELERAFFRRRFYYSFNYPVANGARVNVVGFRGLIFNACLGEISRRHFWMCKIAPEQRARGAEIAA